MAQRYGYTLTVGNTDEQPEKERRYLEMVAARRVDGVILASAGADGVQRLQQRRIPLVLVDRIIPSVRTDSVVHDAYDGGRQLVQHLIEQGYRDIMFVGGMPRISTIGARLDGCRDTMRESGLTLSIRLGRLDLEVLSLGGRKAVRLRALAGPARLALLGRAREPRLLLLPLQERRSFAACHEVSPSIWGVECAGA